MPSFKKDPAVSALKSLIRDQHLNTQQQLCKAMQDLGFNINQSKVSRLLRRMNVVKCKDEDGNITYCLPKEPAPPQSKTVVADLVLMVEANEFLLVIRTSPGAASVIARVLDYHKELLGLLGCLAGDDTIFATPKSGVSIESVQLAIEKLLL